ncbi:DUF3168 domain-containing protein [Paragemmobacter straminiformis]|uniref:DUF3168 domain-containing protein n=1 Tax=Paragemmobacter straminiformis TaxID=2045119 RepID=A0A842I8E9_9RHOB|nr:DUF3168 domain-containing protein [Gemmobacter straminiformis]MBC2835851.1 DUF3168 domain-containing protein [Gemmobacter straminiformis]
MSYASAAALQAAVFQRLTGWPDLAGVAVLDAIPAGGGAGTFVLLGPEEVRDASDRTGDGAEHRLVVSVISDAAGFLAAKTVAVAVSDALSGAALTLAVGRLVGMEFQKAMARRLEDGEVRRIDLTFRARVEV